MKKLFRLLGAVMLSFVVCMSVHTKAAAANLNYDVTILFTHDLHSHFLPSADTDGGEFGFGGHIFDFGTLFIKEERKPETRLHILPLSVEVLEIHADEPFALGIFFIFGVPAHSTDNVAGLVGQGRTFELSQEFRRINFELDR